MYILPYYTTLHKSPFPTKENTTLTVQHLLLIGGTQPWEETDPTLRIGEDILEPNGLYLAAPPQIRGDRAYCPIDPRRTRIEDFYQWSEVETPGCDTFCWRPFYRFHDHQMMSLPSHVRLGSLSLNEVLNDLNLFH